MIHIIVSIHLLISYYLPVTRANGIDISENCPSTTSKKYDDGKFYASLPRLWTLKSTLTIRSMRTPDSQESQEQVLSLGKINSSSSSLQISYDVNENVLNMLIVKRISEGLWFQHVDTPIPENQSFNISITRQESFYEIKINDEPITNNEPALHIDGPQDVYDLVTEVPSLTENVCYWNRTRTAQSEISPIPEAYSVKFSSKCEVQGYMTFPDKMWGKRDMGQPLTENTYLTFVCVWSSNLYLEISLSSNTTNSALLLMFEFDSGIGELEKNDASGNVVVEGTDFEFDGIPKNTPFRLTIERRRTSYEIKLNGHKMKIPEKDLAIDAEDVHNEFSIHFGGRIVRNICLWKSDDETSRTPAYDNTETEEVMEEKDLPIPLDIMPVAVVDEICLRTQKCKDCLFYVGTPEVHTAKVRCEEFLGKVPYLVQVGNECRFIPRIADEWKNVTMQFCRDAISFKKMKWHAV